MVRFVLGCVCWSALASTGLAGELPPRAPSMIVDEAASLVMAQAERPLVSGERVRVKKLARDLESAMETLNRGGIKPFQDPEYRAKWQASVERYREALQRYPQADDPDVQATTAKFREFENMVAFGINQAAIQSADLGDVQARLATVEAQLRAHPAPAWLPAPFGDAEVQAWVARASQAKQVATAATAELAAIAPVANLPDNPGTVQSGAPYDSQDVDRLQRWAQTIEADIAAAISQTLDRLKSAFEAQDAELDYYRQLDPADPNDRMNAYLQEGAAERIYADLDRHLAFAGSVTAYQRAFGKTPTAASLERVAQIEHLRRDYAADRLSALGASVMPAAKAEDAARLTIAQAILAEPEYGFGEHGPIVLTTPDIVEREKQVSRAEIKEVDISLSGDITFSGTETTWHYRWEEFKFAAPLKAESGDWHIWWFTAKRFASGAERTPIGVWVSGAATQGDLILPENF